LVAHWNAENSFFGQTLDRIKELAEVLNIDVCLDITMSNYFTNLTTMDQKPISCFATETSQCQLLSFKFNVCLFIFLNYRINIWIKYFV